MQHYSIKYYIGLTENDKITQVNHNIILEQFNKEFDCYSYSIGKGVWKGEKEDSLMVEIITDNQPRQGGLFYDKIHALALKIKAIAKQDSVLFTINTVEANFV